MKNLAIIVPTYNAKKSIVNLITKIFSIVPGTDVWVIDDSSPDGTAQEVKQKFQKNRQVHLVIRPGKGGRGSAVIDGFKKALADKNKNLFIEMDADGSHDPADLPKFLQEIKHKDVVIGSRYMRGAQIINWLWNRRIFSRLSNLWARLILGVPISDYTNGYRCFQRQVLESLNFAQIRARGFAVLSEIIYQVYQHKFSIGQVPTVFVYRDEIGSNFNPREIKEAFWTVLRLRFSSWKRNNL